MTPDEAMEAVQRGFTEGQKLLVELEPIFQRIGQPLICNYPDHKHAVKLTKPFTVTGNDDLDAHTDALMDELLALEGENITDADVSADLKDRSVEISIVATADDFDSALACADSVIRSAIHATGAHFAASHPEPKGQSSDS